MKRTILLMLCAVMIISMCACRKTASDDGKTEPVSSSEATPKAGAAVAPEAGAAVAPTAGEEDEASDSLGVVDRKALYEVWLVQVGPGKLYIVKDVRELLGGSLKTARDLVNDALEHPPQLIKGYDTMEEAQAVLEFLENDGARCEIREVYH